MSNSRDNIVAFSPSAEESVMLHLLAVALGGQRPPLSEAQCRGVDWAQVMQESIQQAVCPLVFEAASAYQTSIPSEVYERWFATAYTYLRNAHGAFRSQQHLTEMMTRMDYPFIILKGTAAAAYYPDPEQRCFGDVDFLIDPIQREAVETTLAADGYERSGADHVCHVVYRKKCEHLEMHFEIAGIPFGEAGERVRAYINGAEKRSVTQTVGGIEFPAPQPRDHALILLLHMQQHMLGEGIGLRHLCDWGIFVSRTEAEPFWETDVLPLLRVIGLETYAAAMTKTSAMFLGTACPAWAQLVDEGICGGVMADIFSAGNFGRKNELHAASRILVSESGKALSRYGMVGNLANTLHTIVLKRHPIVKKLPILYPFMYVYRAVRYGMLCLFGKRLSLTARVPYAIQRRNLYTQLKVFEPQDDEVTK